MANEELLCVDLLKLLISICSSLGIVLFISACTLLCSTDSFHRQLVRFPAFLRIRDICEMATKTWSLRGKVLISLWSIFSVASFAIFVAHTVQHRSRVVFKKSNADFILVLIDLGLNVYFVLFFLIRYIGTNDKWQFVVSSSSWMEVLTLGPAVTAILGDQKQLLLSFLSALRLSSLKDLLFVVGVVRRPYIKTLAGIVLDLFRLWCIFAGIIYVTENLSHYTTLEDWVLCSDSSTPKKSKTTFLENFYFLIMTTCSMGYTSISPNSFPSKVVIMLFIILVMRFYVTSIPKILAIVRIPQNFGNRKFNKVKNEGHIIYCGTSELSRMTSFFWNFQHKLESTSNNIIRVCLLQSHKISDQISWFLWSFCGRVTLVFGSPSECNFMIQNCKLNTAEAVILTSEAGGARSEFEADRINYLRTIRLKMCAPQCRIIVQIKSKYHKRSFRALPLWRARASTLGALPPDAVLCDNQILLGLMGINSLAPGMATLLINLLSYRESQCSADDSKSDVGGAECENVSWRSAYRTGVKVKFYCVGFTAKYRNRSFKSLALEAYQAHSVLMIGVCMVDKLTGIMTGVINPSFDPGFIINPSTMRAFIISRDDQSVRSFAAGPASGFGGVWIHEWIEEPTQVQSQPADKSTHSLQAEQQQSTFAVAAKTSGPNEEHRLEDWYRDSIDARCGSPRELHAAEHEFNPLLDITGTLHWAPNRCCRKFTIDEARTINFQGHVLVAIIGPLEHPIGLSSLVLPLRNCSIPIDQLSDIVILGNAESIEKHEWRGIRNFPFIYVVDGNGVYPQHLLYCRAQRAAAMTVLNLAQRNNEFFDPFLADKMTLLCTENLRGIGAKNCHVTSELFYSPNAYCFSDPAERMADISAADVMDTQSFAEGLVVSSPNLTGLLASVFFCPESLAFLESIIHGSNQPSVDDYLSLDFCIPSCLSRGDSTNLNRVFGFRLLLLGADDYPLRDIFEMFDCKEMKWEDLLITCLEKFNIICLGVYRRRTVSQKNIDSPYSQSGWFVMTYPEAETQIDKKDKIFCLAPPSQTRGAQASVVIS